MLLLNHRPKETLTKPLTGELLVLLGFQKVVHEGLDHEVYRLKMPWCDEHAQGATFGSEACLVLAGTNLPGPPSWGFGFTYQRDSSTLMMSSTVPTRLLRTTADLEQLLFGIGFETEFTSTVSAPDGAVQTIHKAILALGFSDVRVYRYDVDTVRIRVEDARFTDVHIPDRRQIVDPALEKLPEAVLAQVDFLLLLAPNETKSDIRMARLDFNFNNRRPSMARLPGE